MKFLIVHWLVEKNKQNFLVRSFEMFFRLNVLHWCNLIWLYCCTIVAIVHISAMWTAVILAEFRKVRRGSREHRSRVCVQEKKS